MSVAGHELAQSVSLGRKAALAREILTTYVRVRLLVRRRGVSDTVAVLRRMAPDIGMPYEGRDRLRLGRRLGRVVGRTLGVLPADSRCLIRSLVLTHMLERRGIESTLVIGVSVTPKFEAHAWVESEGIPLLPTGDIEYGRLTEL